MTTSISTTDRNAGIRVLVVDDDPDVAEITATFLERNDDRLAVETAESGEEALTRLDGGAVYDCVVSDYDMPGMDGLDFFESLRSRYHDVPFILYTGKGSEDIASRAISAGVTDYLQKKTGTDQYERLANRIVHATSAHRARRNAAGAEAHLEAVVESLSDVIVTIDPESTICFVNGAVADVFGYAPENVRGESLTMLMPERFRDRHQVAIDAYLAGGERRLDWSNVAFPGLHADGHEIQLSISFGEFTDGTERYFTGIIRDVSEQGDVPAASQD